MSRSKLLLLPILTTVAMMSPAHASLCGNDAGRAPLPLREGLLVPVSPQLAAGPAALDFQGSPLGVSGGENLSVDRVLQRLRQKHCVVDEFAGYVPKTEFDNTPYRFSMDSSKKFTADEFDAWMKKRGVRIAKGGASNTAAGAGEEGATSESSASTAETTPAAKVVKE
ncbi:MAG: hypothetical protein R3F22_00880 [Lysobacteraceae bacterium]